MATRLGRLLPLAQRECLADRVLPALCERRLVDELIERRAIRAVRASPHPIEEVSAWAHASYWVNGRSSHRTSYRRQCQPDW